MADIVNLRRARKQAARKTRERLAAHNCVKFGTPADLRTRAAAERSRADRQLSAARLDRSGKADESSDNAADATGVCSTMAAPPDGDTPSKRDA